MRSTAEQVLRSPPGKVLRVRRTTAVLAGASRALRSLTSVERRRAAALRAPADRADYLAAHVLGRSVVADLLAVSVEDVVVDQMCTGCGAVGHGPPSVAVFGHGPVHVSWSHTRGRVAAVAARQPVGVDLERPSRLPDHRALSDVVLSPAERAQVASAPDGAVAFARWWTQKEALVKVGAFTLDQFGTVDLATTAGRWGGWSLMVNHNPQVDVVLALASRGGGAGEPS